MVAADPAVDSPYISADHIHYCTGSALASVQDRQKLLYSVMYVQAAPSGGEEFMGWRSGATDPANGVSRLDGLLVCGVLAVLGFGGLLSLSWLRDGRGQDLNATVGDAEREGII